MSRAERDDRHRDRAAAGTPSEAVFDPIWARPEPSWPARAPLARRHRQGGDRRRRRRGHRRGLDAPRRARARARDDEPLPLRARQGRAARPDERRDPRRPDRRRRRAAEGLARRRCARSPSPRGPTSSATRGSWARCARGRGRSRAQLAAPLRPVGRRASPRPALDVQTQMEIVALVDDYVFGFVLRASIAVLETREERGRARVDAGRLRLHVQRSSRPGPTRTSRASRQANRAAGGRDEDLAEMALDEGRFERGLDRLLDGVEVELKRRRGR